MPSAPAEGTASLDKALDILDEIGASAQGLSQAQLADKLVLPRTTLYRMLGTLVARGLVRRDPIRRVYCLGFRCFEYARQAYAMPDVVAAASPELRSLRDLTGETSYLAVLDGKEVLSLERCDGAHSHRSATAVGERKPLHCTSQGKAILAALDAPTRDALVRELTLRPLTPRTITDRRRLNAELKLTAARGYSIDDEEIALGVRCVGAPIIDAEGKVRGSISVAGPAYRLTLQRLELLGPEVAQAARRIGQQIAVSRAVAGDASTLIDGDWAFNGAFPRWSAEQKCLYWADTLAPAVRRYDGQSDRQFATVEAPIAGLVLSDHGVLVRHEGGWIRVDGQGRTRAASGWPNEPLRALAAGPDGALWISQSSSRLECRIGSWSAAERFRPQWRVTEPIDALAWDAAGACLYGTAPDSGSIYLMTPGQRSVRRLATVPKGSGRLSGLALDASGGVWTALKDGWGVVRFAADGTLDRVVGLPVPCPTDLTLGGDDGGTLYVTTARHELSIETLGSAPLSGRLFAIAAAQAGR
jgi:DNA-binding IclR family transcriptional regulator/sugar lactone lactonase YvrE